MLEGEVAPSCDSPLCLADLFNLLHARNDSPTRYRRCHSRRSEGEADPVHQLETGGVRPAGKPCYGGSVFSGIDAPAAAELPGAGPDAGGTSLSRGPAD